MIMKNNLLRVVGGIALMLGVALLFTQCETELNGFDSEDTQDLIVETRGDVDCPFGGNFNPADCKGGGGPAISVEELCQRLAALPSPELSDAETKSLLFMREEEKLARDVYLGLNRAWDVPVFEFISKSEQRHMDAVGCLVLKYGLEDPVGENAEGVFTNTALQDLYNDLMEDGLVSLEAAYTVGAGIEDLDIFDLTEALKEVDNDDIKKVYENLTKGSRNHLRAFVRNLNKLGVTYEPVHITTGLFEEIISAPQERGGGILGGDCPNGTPAGDGVDCDGSGPKVTGTQGVMRKNTSKKNNGRRNGKG